MNYQSLLVIGVEATNLITIETQEHTEIRYDTITGGPFNVVTKRTIYTFDGATYDEPQLLEYALNGKGLAMFPTQHDSHLILDDMVIGKEVSKDSGGQCAKMTIKPGDTSWQQIQQDINSIKDVPVSIFTILDYN